MEQSFSHPILAAAKAPQEPIVVIGMHRSGTTLLSKLLVELNVHMGANLERNWESTCFLSINDKMLRLNGADWRNPTPFLEQISNLDFIRQMALIAQKELEKKIDEFGPISPGWRWGWKDPRTTLTLPVWLKLFPQAKVIHIIRNGIDIALSLRRRAWRHFLRPRNNDTERLFPIGATISGYRLWETYLKQAEQYPFSYTDQVFQFRYEDLLENPHQELAKLLNFVGSPDSFEQMNHVAKSIIESPTKHSKLDLMYVRFLTLSGLLNTSCMTRYGYSVDDRESIKGKE